jgi:luciferase family oxidoreductase group 1
MYYHNITVRCEWVRKLKGKRVEYLKLSILDQTPFLKNQTEADALRGCLKLAQEGEALGYTRYWLAEHHNFSTLACSAPEVLLGYIGAQTKSIRIGSGAVLLPHYKPYKVAEWFNTLAALFPGRVNRGIGRAPGGSAEATNALSDQFLQKVWNMPTVLKELLQFLDDDFPVDHSFTKVKARTFPEKAPIPWLLGISKKSAKLAAENGMAYAFGLFMSDLEETDFIKEYKRKFTPRIKGRCHMLSSLYQ